MSPCKLVKEIPQPYSSRRFLCVALCLCSVLTHTSLTELQIGICNLEIIFTLTHPASSFLCMHTHSHESFLRRWDGVSDDLQREL